MMGNGGYIIPTIEATIMAGIAAVPQAKMYNYASAMHDYVSLRGGISVWVGCRNNDGMVGMGLTMTMMLAGAPPRSYHNRRLLENNMFRWKNPQHIILAMPLICTMLWIGEKVLQEKFPLLDNTDYGFY